MAKERLIFIISATAQAVLAEATARRLREQHNIAAWTRPLFDPATGSADGQSMERLAHAEAVFLLLTQEAVADPRIERALAAARQRRKPIMTTCDVDAGILKPHLETARRLFRAVDVDMNVHAIATAPRATRRMQWVRGCAAVFVIVGGLLAMILENYVERRRAAQERAESVEEPPPPPLTGAEPFAPEAPPPSAGPPPIPSPPAAADPRNRPARQRSGSISTDDYPAAALRAEAEGTVAMALDIGTDGRVSACRVTATSGSAVLDASTCELVRRRYRYDPAMRDGRPAPGTQTLRVIWRLSDYDR